MEEGALGLPICHATWDFPNPEAFYNVLQQVVDLLKPAHRRPGALITAASASEALGICNLNKAYNSGIDLLGRINKTKCILAPLQKPYCYKGTLAAIPGRADFIPSSRSGGPRAAIFADKLLKIREVTHLCTRDLAAGVCVIGNKQTLIVSAYLDINHNVRSDAIKNILEYKQVKCLGLILALDSNAHSTLWGHTNNPRGSALTEIISDYGLLLRNIGKEFTYDCQLGKSVIDLTLTCYLEAGILDWKVNRALNFSDHNTISFTIAAEILELPPGRPWAKADWDTFEKELEEHDWETSMFITEKKRNHWVDRLMKMLTNTLNKACPLSPARTINKNNSRWHLYKESGGSAPRTGLHTLPFLQTYQSMHIQQRESTNL